MRSASVVWVVCCLALAARGYGQETPATSSAPLVADDAAAIAIGVDELRLRLLPLRREELDLWTQAWMERLERHAQKYVELQLAATSTGTEPPEEVQAAARQAKADGALLLERYRAVIDALQQKGGDVDEHKQYAATLATVMTVERTAPDDASGPAPARVIPKLAPYDPLSVAPDELKLRLRRFRKAGLQEEVETWLGRLQSKTEQIAAVDIAARSLQGDEQARLIELATRLKEERSALVERTRITLGLLEARGGDVEEYRQYVRTVTGGLVEDLSDMDVTSVGSLATLWNTLVAWSKSKEGGRKVLANVGRFLAILALAWILAVVLARVVATSLRRFGRTSALLREFLINTTRRLVLLIGLVVAVSKLGVDIGPLVAVIGAAGLVIGFALQGTLSNFASGILILLYRPFDIGDAVEVGGVTGKVEAMTMVSTTVATFDNQLLVVPNNSVWNNVIKNVTGKPTRRVDLLFGIGYGDDIEKAREILEDIVTTHELVLKDPEPVIRLHALGDSSVNFIVRPWARTSDYWNVYWDVTRRVKERFDAEGVTIPFPQRDVHVYQAGPPEASGAAGEGAGTGTQATAAVQ